MWLLFFLITIPSFSQEDLSYDPYIIDLAKEIEEEILREKFEGTYERFDYDDLGPFRLADSGGSSIRGGNLHEDYDAYIAETWCKISAVRRCESYGQGCISPMGRQEAEAALGCMDEFRGCLNEGYLLCELDGGYSFWMGRELDRCKSVVSNGCFKSEMGCVKGIKHNYQKAECEAGYRRCVDGGYDSCDLEFSLAVDG